MRLVARCELQELGSGRKSGRGAAGARAIVPGCRVAVLEGRHFSTFGSGDEGVVLSVDPEALNCQVHFEGRPRPVPVALRHLRVVAASEEPPLQQDPGREGCEEMQEPVGAGTEPCLAEDGVPPGGVPARGPSAVPTPKLAEPAANDDWLRRGWLEPTQLRQICPRPTRPTSLPPRTQGGCTASAPQLLLATQPAASSSASAANGPGMADIVLQSSQASRLEAVEARLADLEEEHRQEVASLRHALKECVTAINACSRVVNMMCVAASESPTEWERTAAALHQATNLGMRVLDGASHGGAVSSTAGACIPVECCSIAAPGGSAALPSAEPVAEGPAGRRFLVASLHQQQSPRAPVPQHPSAAAPVLQQAMVAPQSAPTLVAPGLQPVPVTPQSAAATPTAAGGPTVHTHPMSGPPLMIPGWQGPWAAPPSPSGGEHGPGPPKQLVPPAGLNLFGGFGPMQANPPGGYSAFCPGA
mmetsp:Transcript_61091/g.192125  ORF Transcript_61091/g.192125 Transcript_61091/m.192125 type:complete len:474 (+) Transcript_61091:63-1484(+)